MSLGSANEVSSAQRDLEEAQNRLSRTDGAIRYLDQVIASGNVPQADMLANLALEDPVATNIGRTLQSLDEQRTQ